MEVVESVPMCDPLRETCRVCGSTEGVERGQCLGCRAEIARRAAKQDAVEALERMFNDPLPAVLLRLVGYGG